jgi:hypothetical protein
VTQLSLFAEERTQLLDWLRSLPPGGRLSLRKKKTKRLKPFEIDLLQDALEGQSSQSLQPDWPAEKQEQLDKALVKLRPSYERLHYQQDPPGPIE